MKFLLTLMLALTVSACQVDKPVIGDSSTYLSIGASADSESGHCTAVHIGNGNYITAAHCIPPSTSSLKNWIGDWEMQVFWVNREYDVAFLTMPVWDDEGDFIAAPAAYSTLDCNGPKVGDEVISVGNPLDLRDFTSYGYIGRGEGRVAHWKNVVVGNIAIAPGNSGGPIYNTLGRVVGISVGGFSPFANVAIIVPSNTICALMGKV